MKYRFIVDLKQKKEKKRRSEFQKDDLIQRKVILREQKTFYHDPTKSNVVWKSLPKIDRKENPRCNVDRFSLRPSYFSFLFLLSFVFLQNSGYIDYRWARDRVYVSAISLSGLKSPPVFVPAPGILIHLITNLWNPGSRKYEKRKELNDKLESSKKNEVEELGKRVEPKNIRKQRDKMRWWNWKKRKPK